MYCRFVFLIKNGTTAIGSFLQNLPNIFSENMVFFKTMGHNFLADT